MRSSLAESDNMVQERIPKFSPGQTLAIIPCTSQKSEVGGPARDVWIGSHFQYVLAHCEMFYDNVLIMSYKYGLISPDFVIEPYDIDMKDAKPAEKIKWWFTMRQDIHLVASFEPLLIALYTGDFERERIMREFVKQGVRQIILPFQGLSVGRRLAAVYDCEPPFDPEKAQEHFYDLPENYGGVAPGSLRAAPGSKYMPPETNLTDPIVWE